ncbi:Crp/Fnr family transcriptional regulator [Shigella sonnei]|uniref:Crp/Fnr family transcriptional regulator n=1 Tax=Enterobacteriaceae TaxID=543 RepID=UPI0006642A54|nr:MULTISPECIES: Crp/Fnr family transcriptional regulator [Enterobacteriaceae]EFW9296955.1 Crp/Fnr family transcriptional regulator [Shigella flexneri]EFC7755412.1 Crp/Fnr family transcriptional regulator [Escherichia coli]EFX1742918.1 Crp/Fnr family transcriptional regulator [Shigella sonnei]EFX2140513.1 Crp/Fnr family transcriptional regulator [Shigella flexneri]EFX2269268.1 Crp/Fnr family transcriptional regulator [Shigella sonnei]
MQLKPLTKGRFHNIWQQNDAFIEKTFRELLSETQLIHEGDYLFRQGQVVDRLIMVETGRISLSYSAENGRCFQFGTMDCDEQLFGEMEFFTGYLCQLDIVAEEPLIVGVCSSERLEAALDQHPKLALFFASAIAVDYQDTLEIFLHRMLYPIAHNIAYDLYRQHQNKQPMDGFSKNYKEAERFGTTDRVYRRAVKTLVDAGLVIRTKQGLEIKNLDELRRFLGNDSFD